LVPIIKFKRPSLHLDYFRDAKDRICQVLTWLHPSDKKLCIVKYDLGTSYWTSRETGLQYKRILKSYSLEGHQDNLELIKKIEPSYLYTSIVFGVDFLAVPIDKIKHYYYPEERLQEILDEGKGHVNDDIEHQVKKLTELLNVHLNIPFENMGITGSILWKAQTEKSDIDFIVYGNDYAQDFNDRFPVIYDSYPGITPMTEAKTRRYVRSMSNKSGLSEKITRKYIAMKTWLGMFGKTNLSLIFSPKANELPFSYGDQIFEPLEPITLKCTITNTDFGFAYPAIYEISDCEILSELKENKDLPINRIFSFEGALTGYFRKDDVVIVRGLLERVTETKTNKQFYQIILGTKECLGNEFIVYQDDFKRKIS